MKHKQRWIQSAFRKGKRGALRARLVSAHAMSKDAKRIPADVLRRAAGGAFGPVTQKRAVLARTLRKLR